MKCTIHELGELRKYIYVAIVSRYGGHLLLSRHAERHTWETQGGHIEPGETPERAARRELYEESGALEYTLYPLCDYWAAGTGGVAFYAEIERLGPLPPSEMVERRRFDEMPRALTYPEITPKLIEKARQVFGPWPKWKGNEA